MSILPSVYAVKIFSRRVLGVLYFSIGVCLLGSTWAEQARGETYFQNPPVLTQGFADNVSATYSYANYYFGVKIPQNGDPLGGLAITIPTGIQTDANKFPSSENIKVTDGRGKPIAFQMTLQERTVQLIFSQPASPGQKITVQFYPMSNPRFGGSFQFGISALSAGKQPQAQFLGNETIIFIQSYN